jgi:hypothetical protein
MVPIKVTGSAVIETLREVVAEQPEYVYEAPEQQTTTQLSCFYVHGSVPGCVVGHVLNRLGVPLHVLAGYEGSDARLLVDRTLSFDGDPEDANDARLALQAAQAAQDGGMTWGGSLALALGD